MKRHRTKFTAGDRVLVAGHGPGVATVKAVSRWDWLLRGWEYEMEPGGWWEPEQNLEPVPVPVPTFSGRSTAGSSSALFEVAP